LTQFSELGDRRLISMPLGHLGRVAFYQGDYERARRLLEESLNISRELQFQEGIAKRLGYLGRLAIKQGDFMEARDLLRESILTMRLTQVELWFTDSLEAYVAVLVEAQEMERAVRLLGSASALRERLNRPVPPVDCAFVEQARAAARAALGEEAFAAAWSVGQSTSYEESIAYALDQQSSGR
jgi:uncharacterized protein HemY